MDLPDYRHILWQEYQGRVGRHVRYSMRAFARHLAISPTHLSEVLNRRKSLSEETAADVAQRLGWDPQRTRFFRNLVRLEAAGSETLRAAIVSELGADRTGEGEAGEPAWPFEPVAGDDLPESFAWYYLTVPDLFGLKTFRPDVRWIARKLKITVVEAEAAIAWLRSKGVLEGHGPTLRRRVVSYVVHRPREAVVRRMYRESLDIAKAALPKHSGSNSEYGVVTLTFGADRWPEAIKRIRAFQADMARLARPGEDDAVYQLGIQFLRVDDPDV
jgi:uncharacterized protein (TIGR02147 family)